jgi:hypothetical protein
MDAPISEKPFLHVQEPAKTAKSCKKKISQEPTEWEGGRDYRENF